MALNIKFFSILLIANFLSSFQQISDKETCLTQNQGDNRYGCYSPDGNRIIFESNRDGNWEIYMMGNDGSNQTRLTRNNTEDRRPSWHPDGEKIIFENMIEERARLLQLDLKTGETEVMPLPGKPRNALFARFSPTGEFIAYSAQDDKDQYNIYLLNPATLSSQVIVSSAHKLHYPNWSPDGTKLVMFSRMDTENSVDEVYKYYLAHKKLTRLTHWPKHNFCPAWSADGQQIAYVTSMDGIRPEVYVMDSKGKNQRRITYNEDGDTLPCWSPDNQSLLITGYRHGNFQICRVRLDQ